MPNQPHNARHLPLNYQNKLWLWVRNISFWIFSSKAWLIVGALAKSYQIMSISSSESICVVWYRVPKMCLGGTRDTYMVPETPSHAGVFRTRFSHAIVELGSRFNNPSWFWKKTENWCSWVSCHDIGYPILIQGTRDTTHAACSTSYTHSCRYRWGLQESVGRLRICQKLTSLRWF